MDTFYEQLNTIFTLWNQIYSRWISEELFSSAWFAILGSMVVAYTLLYLLIDRKRMRELFFYGSLLSVAFGFIDVAGTTFGLWAYKTHFLPLIPALFPSTFTLHPIMYMIAYQYSPDWRTFTVNNTIATVFFAFVTQPLYIWAGILWFENWNYLYSFVLSGSISFFARAVVLWMAKVEQNHAPETSRISLSPKFQPAMKPLNKDDENK